MTAFLFASENNAGQKEICSPKMRRKFTWKEEDGKIIRAALSTHFPPPIDGGNKYPSFPTSYTELPFS
jgi:hypothetical protein